MNMRKKNQGSKFDDFFSRCFLEASRGEGRISAPLLEKKWRSLSEKISCWRTGQGLLMSSASSFWSRKLACSKGGLLGSI